MRLLGFYKRRGAALLPEEQNCVALTLGTLSTRMTATILTLCLFLLVEVLNRLHSSELLQDVLGALPSGVLSFVVYRHLLIPATGPDARMSDLLRFCLRYFVLFFLPPMAGIYALTFAVEALPTGNDEQILFSMAQVAGLVAVFILPILFLGAALPAGVVGVNSDVRSAIATGRRQAPYVLAMLFGFFVFFIALALAGVMLEGLLSRFSIALETWYVLLFSGVKMLLSSMYNLVFDAFVAVVFSLAFVKDLRETGRFSLVDSSVFD